MLDPANASMEDSPQAQKPARQMNVWVIIAIVVIALILLCLLVACLVIVILALLGPSVGNVFSNIIEQIGTPTP